MIRVGMIALGGCIKAPPVAYGLTPDTGGHITYLMEEALALAERFDVSGVDIYTRRFRALDLGEEYDRAVEEVNAKVRIIRISSGDPRYLSKEALAKDLDRWTNAFVDHLSDGERPDIIHAHFADAAHAAAAARNRFGIPFIYTAHSLAADKAAAMAATDRSLDRRLGQETAAIAKADGVIGSSRDECERQLLQYDGARPERIHQVAPGTEPLSSKTIDLDGARRVVAPFLREPGKPFLLAIARPVEKKNLVPLVEAFGRNAQLRERANLVILAGLRDDIAAEDEECQRVHRQLLEAVDRHDLYGKVAYPKRHDRSQVDGLYALAAEQRGIFVNNALFEPYGLTIVEAAAHGVPVIVTDRGGPADIIEHYGHGIAIDPSDGDTLAAEALALLDDAHRWTRYSIRGRATAQTGDWSHYAARFMQIAGSIGAPRLPAQPQAELLAICDIDNTLTGCMAGARRFGRLLESKPQWRFGVATGRSLQQAEAALQRWNLPRPSVMITSVGSEIYWCLPSGGRIADTGFADKIAEGWDVDGVTQALLGLPGLSPQPDIEQRRFKRSYFFDGAETVGRVRARLSAAGVEARVIASHDRLLDVLPARAGKAAALFWVSDRLGLAPEQVVAAGDSGNDEDMLTACPNAILVANHEPAIAHLGNRPNVHAVKRPHANGVIEGLIHASRTIREASA
ncbi:HAD-IIB family hydrolase [Sphingomicrobium arenosum]|uniref:HAD-IIB family hydrolase n=1 Tax=Sphingomicrobium arenosum TaxID=2233861 RepID=UPI002240144F|nr:HAD-IIB family hydrolase [Sphingomicrobium arenosum]